MLKSWAEGRGWGFPALLVLALALALYAGTLGHPPIWDDRAYVAGQPFLQDCGNLRLVLNPRYLLWVLPVENSARPAWLASVLWDSCLYGGAWAGLRLSNLLWHGLGAVLLLALAWELSRDRWCALLAALLFAAHPLHTEPVNFIAFRADLMALAFMLLSLCLYLRGRARPGWAGRLCLAASLACFAAAALSKEMAVTLPALVLLADALAPRLPDEPAPRAGRRPRWALYGLFLLTLGLFAAFRTPRSGYRLEPQQARRGYRLDAPRAPEWDFAAQAEAAAPDFMPWERVYREPGARARTMSGVAGAYLLQLFWPAALQGDYAPAVPDSWLDGKVLASALAWLALLAAAWRLRRVQPAASFGLLWVPVTLLPVSGIIPLLNLRADRYLYVPSAGWCLAAAAGLCAAARARRPALRAAGWALGLVLLCAFAWRTAARNADYRDELAFHQATDRLDPGVPRNHMNLALALQRAGQPRAAEEHLRRALSLWPGYNEARLLLAQTLLAQGRPGQALALLRAGLPWGQGRAGYQFKLGRAWELSGRPQQALDAYAAASRLDPAFWPADLRAGAVLLRLGRLRQARARLEQALRTTRWRLPEGIYHLALAYRGLGLAGQERRARAVLRQAAPTLAASYPRMPEEPRP
ncbi:MAG: tetratricopeptide repeat protein [Elusimicrobia bacterium]|nr:tetratricopeptide repeat protein [Elusimicrobiota bacterium]